MVDLLSPWLLVVNGLAAGVLVGTQLGGWPLLRGLPPGPYVHAHAFFSTRYDPFMPACLLLTVAGALLLALTGPGLPERVSYGLAAAAATATVAISLLRNVPVNRWVRQLDPDRLPADFPDRDPRPAWGRWNRIRTWSAVTALLLNAAGTTLAS